MVMVRQPRPAWSWSSGQQSQARAPSGSDPSEVYAVFPQESQVIRNVAGISGMGNELLVRKGLRWLARERNAGLAVTPRLLQQLTLDQLHQLLQLLGTQGAEIAFPAAHVDADRDVIGDESPGLQVGREEP